MTKNLFVSYWAMCKDGSGLQSFMGNQEVQWRIERMGDVELLEAYIKRVLNDTHDVPVEAVTIINWKPF